MKKMLAPAILLALSLNQLQSQVPEDLSIDLGFGYESKYVSSGAQGAEGSLQPEIVLTYQNWGAGIWANLAQESRDNYGDEYNFFAWYALPIDDVFEASVGVTYYYFPQDYAVPSRTRELNFALGADVLFEPAAYFNYDIDFEQWEVGIEAGYGWELQENLALVTGGAIGYIHANDGDSDQVPGKTSDGYAYIELAANIEYALDDKLTFSAGPRVSANNNGAANTDGDESEIWFGAAVSYSY